MEEYCGKRIRGKRIRGKRMNGVINSIKISKRGICMAMIGLFMIGFGIYRGEAEIVLEKAVNICMECIGIG